jgi:DNA repair protein SbcD/Mre11
LLTFIHAADLHLDSPLVGLRARTSERAERIEGASRAAFDQLVALAIAEAAAFVVLSGDVFDGQWRDYRTGVFFAERMKRLRDAGIRVFVIRGNHDAENRFMQRLALSDNVHVLGADAPETLRLDELGVAIHGQSYGRRDVLENLARGYPAPLPGYLNVGLLHTACTGRAGHTAYAPCTVDELVQRGYEYWALGHVHAFEVLSEAPHVVFSGNLQGRSVRETGPKGAVVVRTEGGRVLHVEHRALDAVRWEQLTLDASPLAHADDVLDALRARLDGVLDSAEGRPVVLRVSLTGPSSLHDRLVTGAARLEEELATLLAGQRSEVWLEKLRIDTTREARPFAPDDPSVLGELSRVVAELAQGPEGEALIARVLTELAPKLPGSVFTEDVLERLRAEATQHGKDLALALLEKGRG